MTQPNNSDAVQNNMTAYGKPMIIGGAIALIVICMFVFSARNPNPEWGSLWMIKPLIITPLVGAMGGLFFFLVNYYFAKWSLNKYLAIALGVLGFIISIWMGIVLGLNGTMWN